MNSLDCYFNNCLKQLAQIHGYDFLHGILGIGFYYLCHSKYFPNTSVKTLSIIWRYLKNTALVNEENQTAKWVEYCWDYNLRKRIDTRFNLSLSHGQSSIIRFLTKLYESQLLGNDENKAIRKLLRQAVNYILAQRIDFKSYGSCFPNMSLESISTIVPSRLAWCYGDLGIAIALYWASKILKDSTIELEAINVLELNTFRRTLNETQVTDRFLCHGTAGIAQIYYRMFLETRRGLFWDAYCYWKDLTLAWHGLNKDENESSFSILEGNLGVGLMLLSEFDADWDSLLLLH